MAGVWNHDDLPLSSMLYMVASLKQPEQSFVFCRVVLKLRLLVSEQNIDPRSRCRFFFKLSLTTR